ncbi:hypothetical protein C5167_037142 [Papaver somniferum]|uniref:Replication factor A C-terminal domain-containing protein n=1 Tax=Papaver somniferum TaxID=3469 RepID=A0A4Y7I9M8_PAPSO|nr:hypothetical protein C5167_037142 [Papaver somniferum]
MCVPMKEKMSLSPYKGNLTEAVNPPFPIQATNILICNATATYVLIGNGWHYLACHRCSKKVVGDGGDLWCTKCEAKVELPSQVEGDSNTVDGPYAKKPCLDETTGMEDNKNEAAE